MGDESNVASFTPSIVAKDSSHLATQSIANLDPSKVRRSHSERKKKTFFIFFFFSPRGASETRRKRCGAFFKEIVNDDAPHAPHTH